jgi:cell division septum initiation protein DivIVA
MDTDTERSVAAGNGVATPEAASRAAVHLLELAAHDAEVWRAEAKSEGAAVVDAARAEAAQLVEASRAEAEQIRAEARAEADRVRGELAESRNRHDAEVARLRRLDRDYREQMRTHLTALLDQVGESPSEDG